jgi:LPXTG-motif cell wall-anchored protein
LLLLGLLFSSASLALATQQSPGTITLPGDRFFPEGVTVAKDGTFYAGSIEEGTIVRAAPGASQAEPFIAAGANDLVSVLGVYADDARGLLWACSSDAGNGKLTGSAPVAVKAFDHKTGEPKGSWDLPGGGFCNDLTIDPQGNVYASDSWSPRILRLPSGGSALEEWINDPQLGAEQWGLNGLDFDAANSALYVVNQRAGKLFRIAVGSDGKAGAVTQISTSQELRRPDGLKLVAPNTLAAAEGGSGGMALIKLNADSAEVTRVSEGLNGVATFAFWNNSAWIVENQGQHFWDPAASGRDAKPPFRLVEVPLPLGSPAAAPQPEAPSTLPKTGSATGTTAHVLSALLLVLLGGLLLRRARTRG